MVKNNINQHDFFINSEVSYQSDNIITAIDIGSDKIICFIAKIDKILDKEKPRIVGFGHSQSKGIRNGAITNITELEKSIRRAVDQAENLAGFEVKNVSVNISGNYIGTERLFGELSVDSGIINHDHIVEVIDDAKKKFNSKKVIIDASSAHRVSKGWEYGFPELNNNKRKLIKGSNRISNPGCYPTGALSLIRPLVENNFIWTFNLIIIFYFLRL